MLLLCVCKLLICIIDAYKANMDTAGTKTLSETTKHKDPELNDKSSKGFIMSIYICYFSTYYYGNISLHKSKTININVEIKTFRKHFLSQLTKTSPDLSNTKQNKFLGL